ncbi:MAG: DNA polymerase III subunit alpha [Mycoplasma sp.]
MNVVVGINSSYSILNSLIKLEVLFDELKKEQVKYVGVFEVNNLYSLNRFNNLAIENNFVPIIGIDIECLENNFVLVAKNNNGYYQLVKINNLLNNQSKPLDSLTSLIDLITDDLICIIRNVKDVSNFKSIKNLFQNYLSKYSDVKKIYCPRIRFIKKSDSENYKVIRCIANQWKLEEFKETSDFVSLEDFIKSRLIEEIKKTTEMIFQSCDVKFEKQESQFIKYPTTTTLTSADMLKKYSESGLKARFLSMTNINEKIYYERLNYELKVINDLNFNDYFLVVYDYTTYARKKGIMVGFGRGSAAGSLVSYCLGITNVDPIKYNLIFERFLNPDRKSPPDIDIDFQDNRRDEVFNYILEKYSSNNVASIITFQTIKVKMAIRDIGRVLDIPLHEIDALAKLVSIHHDNDLDYVVNRTLAIKKKIAENKKIKKLFDICYAIIDNPRQVGQHAAGMIMSKKPLNDFIPININEDGLAVTQFDMNELEYWGLWKVDILGLKNLTILKDILILISKNHKKTISLEKLPINDKKTFALLSSANTLGIFQLESYGMKNVLTMVEPNKFSDLCDIISLYRPGPQDQVELYAKRKKDNEQIKLDNDVLEKILKPTLGIIIYQEQIMQIASSFANLTLAQADNLRRGMSKKDQNLILQQKELFINGAIKKGYSETEANRIFDLIEKFAGYGFNKSHAVAYALLGYYLAYLKANYSEEFYTCLLSNNLGDYKKLSEYMREINSSSNVKVGNLKLNETKHYFVLLNQEIIPSIYIIKGFGRNYYELFDKERKISNFNNDPIETITRLVRAKISEKIIQSMIVLNAFQSDKYNQTTLLKNLNKIVKYSHIVINKNNEIDFSLVPKIELTQEQEDYPLLSNLEEESIGFNIYYSLDRVIKKQRNIPLTISEIKRNNITNFKICVQVTYVKEVKTKNQKNICFLQTKDYTGELDFVVFENKYEELKPKLKSTNYLVIDATKSIKDNKLSYIVKDIELIEVNNDKTQ